MTNSDAAQFATRVETALRNNDGANRQNLMDGINRDLGRLSQDRTLLPQLTAELERRGALPQLMIAEFGNQVTLNRLGAGDRVNAANLGQIAAGERGTPGERATPLDRIAAREMNDTYMHGRAGNMTPEQVQAHYRQVQLAGGMRGAIDNLRDIMPAIATSRDDLIGQTGNRALNREDITRALASQTLTAPQRQSLEFLNTNFDQVTDSIQSRWLGSRVISLQDMEGALHGGLEPALMEHLALTDGRVGERANPAANPAATPAEARTAALVEQSRAHQGEGPDRVARRLLGADASNGDVLNLSNEMMRLFASRHQDRQLVAQNGRQVLDRLYPGDQLLNPEDVPTLAQRFAALRTN